MFISAATMWIFLINPDVHGVGSCEKVIVDRSQRILTGLEGELCSDGIERSYGWPVKYYANTSGFNLTNLLLDLLPVGGVVILAGILLKNKK